MSSQSLNYGPAINCSHFEEYFITECYKNKPYRVGANELMYAVQQGDVEKVKKIVKEQVSKLLFI